MVIYEHVSKLQLEASAGVHALHPANTECPQCKGSGRVPMHHGLRDKECPRCGGRGWIKSLGRGALTDPGNEILNAERNCSRYIVLPRAATQGASSGEPLLTCGKLFQVNAGTDGVLPRGVQ